MPDSLSDSACQVEPEDWERHIFVYCTAFQPARLLDRFFAIADHGSASCRETRLCLVLTFEHRRYNPTTAAERCPGLRERGIRFIYADARPAVPAVLDNVSIELDQHTAADGRTCLLRKNSEVHKRYFGEVRCEFGAVLEAALAVWSRPATIRVLQCAAAIHGGVLPRGQRNKRSSFSTCGSHILPTDLLLRRMPSTWCRYKTGLNWNLAEPCAVFCTAVMPLEVLDDFLDEVNFLDGDINHRIRVKVVDTAEDSSEYSLITASPVPNLSNPFIGLSTTALCRFVQHKCKHTFLSSKYFIVLDAVTPHSSTCLICDANHDNTDRPLFVRCTFDACADILGEIATNDSLTDFANEAATSRGGYISTPPHLVPSHIPSLATPGLDEPIRSRTLTRSMSQYLTQQITSDTPKFHTISKTGGDSKSKDCTPDPDFEYFKLTQSVAIGAATQQPTRTFVPPKRFGSRDSGIGESARSVRYFDVGDQREECEDEDEISEEDRGWATSPTLRLGSRGKGEGGDGYGQDGCGKDEGKENGCEEDGDGWFDLMLPDVSGFTQMSCD